MDVLNFMKEQINNRNKTEVLGKLPVGLIREFRDICEDKDHVDRQIEIRKQQMILELEQKLKDEFSTRVEAIENRQNSIWNEIYTTLDIDPNGHYYLNRKTGEVFKSNDEEKSYY
jgi:hypothetical protein